MTQSEAIYIIEAYYNKSNPSEEDEILFLEACNYLIEVHNDPRAMMDLGGHHYEARRFDLALKYYEMAAALDYDPADECLGYIWYYGRTGERNYEKAFYYFSKMMKRGNLVATYKVADMYKNGYYVEKNYDKYVSMIEELYPQVVHLHNVFDPVPEVFTRLARIRIEQGDTAQAKALYLRAKRFLEQRIRYNAFFGNLNIMKWLIDDLYTIEIFDPKNFDFYDLYFLLKNPHRITFCLGFETLRLETEFDGSECAVCFNGKWFRDRDDFFAHAEYNGEKLTAIYDRFTHFELEE